MTMKDTTSEPIKVSELIERARWLLENTMPPTEQRDELDDIIDNLDSFSESVDETIEGMSESYTRLRELAQEMRLCVRLEPTMGGSVIQFIDRDRLLKASIAIEQFLDQTKP